MGKSTVFNKKSIIMKVGLLLPVIFVTSTQLIWYSVNRKYSEIETQQMQEQAKDVTDYVRSELMSYKSLPWLIDYWENDYADMDIPIGGINDEAWRKRHKTFIDIDVKSITVDEANAYSADEQKELAETCYMRCASFFDRVKSELHLFGLNGSMYRQDRDEDVAFAFFLGVDDTSEDERYSLGSMWPYHAELHPVAAKIYRTGEDIVETERVTSTTDGKEYLLVYSPVSVEGTLRFVICASFLWSDVYSQITAGSSEIGLVNAFLLFIEFIFLLMVLYLIVIRPVMKLQRVVRSYTGDKDSSAITSKLLPIEKTSDEIGFLAADVHAMIDEIDRHIDEVRLATAEKERVAAELSMAAKIQADSLPGTFPAFPERTEFDLYASMIPAKEVGGDLYDFFFIDSDHLALVIADVSGKGMPAALFMMEAKTMIKDKAKTDKSPAQILTEVNDGLMENNKEQLFITTWLMIIELSSGIALEANAGHCKPVLCHEGGQYELVRNKHSTALALMEGIKITEFKWELKRGDRIFVYTDGVTEAVNDRQELFGTERLLEALNEVRGVSQKEALLHVKESVDAFVSDEPQFDDMTVLGFTYLTGK